MWPRAQMTNTSKQKQCFRSVTKRCYVLWLSYACVICSIHDGIKLKYSLLYVRWTLPFNFCLLLATIVNWTHEFSSDLRIRFHMLLNGASPLCCINLTSLALWVIRDIFRTIYMKLEINRFLFSYQWVIIFWHRIVLIEVSSVLILDHMGLFLTVVSFAS